MEPILFDSSVWINALRGAFTPPVELLRVRIEQNSVTVRLTPTVLQEVLQSIRQDSAYETVKESFLSYPFLHLPPIEAALSAADLYRSLRKKGVTIRKPNDCLIAVFAIHFGIELCHNDVDFDLIAQHSKLQITSF